MAPARIYMLEENKDNDWVFTGLVHTLRDVQSALLLAFGIFVAADIGVALHIDEGTARNISYLNATISLCRQHSQSNQTTMHSAIAKAPHTPSATP